MDKPEGVGGSRLESVDLLRGLTIGFMMLVNNPGSSQAYAPLKHAAWNGFTPTDLVFPTFLFLVGMTTVFSLGGRMDRGVARARLFWSVLRRAVTIYAIGLAVSTFPWTEFDHMRFVGVLPRIALCYLVVGSMYLVSRGWRDKVLLLAVSLVGYWLLVRFVPVPGYGVPVRDVPLLHPDGNLAAWLDRAMFAPEHLYEKTRDPEGLLSTIPAVGTALLGVLAGIWVKTERALTAKIAGIAGAGAVSIVLGLIWNPWFPINKKMWTSSYVLFAGGLSLLLLAAAMAAVDLPKRRPGLLWPLRVFGTNAIAAYVLADLLEGTVYSIHLAPHYSLHHRIWDWMHAGIGNASLCSLMYSVCFVGVCWLVVYFALYRRGIFLRV
jgi:predicted acyltransferase